MKKIILFSLICFTSCSSTNTISITSEIVVENDAKVDWAITHEDSIVDFTKSKIGYAVIKINSLVYETSEDSIKIDQLSNFRTIHTFEDSPTSLIIIGSIVAFVAINYYLLGGIKL